jgi:RNA polymerase sigma-70 factor (ECF subfamily)
VSGARSPHSTEQDVVGWIAEAREGSATALGRLMSFCRDYLLLVANRELDPALQAKASPSDLVQETHLEAVRGFADFRGSSEAELIGWLRRMLLHNIHNAQRHYAGTEKRRLSREVSLDDAAAEQFAADLPSPSSHLRRKEQAQAVARAVDRLPEDQRQVILWHHQDGLSFEEIGHRLGRSPGAARKLWSRAVRQLRMNLQAP